MDLTKRKNYNNKLKCFYDHLKGFKPIKRGGGQPYPKIGHFGTAPLAKLLVLTTFSGRKQTNKKRDAFKGHFFADFVVLRETALDQFRAVLNGARAVLNGAGEKVGGKYSGVAAVGDFNTAANHK